MSDFLAKAHMSVAQKWVQFLAITLPLFLLDQATKWWVLKTIPKDASIPVIPGFFNLVHVYNTGAAFGMGQNNNGFFLGLSTIALLVLLILWMRGVFQEPSTKLAVLLLIPGVAGNLMDRFLYGHVVDFLDVILPGYGHWPAFNVADSCICISAVILVLTSLFSPAKKV